MEYIDRIALRIGHLLLRTSELEQAVETLTTRNQELEAELAKLTKAEKKHAPSAD